MKKIQFLGVLLCAIVMSACQHEVHVDVHAYLVYDGTGSSNCQVVAHIYDSVFNSQFTHASQHSLDFDNQSSYDAQDDKLKECAKIAEAIVDARNLQWDFSDNCSVYMKRTNGNTYKDNDQTITDADLIYEHTFGDTKIYEESDMESFMAIYSIYFAGEEVEKYVKSMTFTYNDLATGKPVSEEILPGKENKRTFEVMGKDPNVFYTLQLNLKDDVTMPDNTPCEFSHDVSAAVNYKNEAIQIVQVGANKTITGSARTFLTPYTRSYQFRWNAETHRYRLQKL